MQAETIIAKIIRTHPEATLPRYATLGSSGMDLTSVENKVIQPGEFAKIDTGIKIQIGTGNHSFDVQVRPRSGLAAKHGVTVLNSPGTIDPSYTGNIGVVLINHGKLPFIVSVGDRIAQLVVLSQVVNVCDWEDLTDKTTLETTERGDGGFGSTGY